MPRWFKKRSVQRPFTGNNPALLRRLRFGVLFFFVLTLVMALLATIRITQQDYEATLQEAERQSLSLVRSLDEHTTRSLVSVEQAMQNLVEDFERVGGVSRMDEHWAHERLKGKIALTPQIRGIIAIDAKGILSAHGLEYPTRRVDLSDRSYFPYHRDRNDIRLRISEPLISRTDYKWLIPVTRRINNVDNSFGGVMLSGVEPDFFLHFYASLHLDKGTRIHVMRNDGVVLLTYPLDITLLGTNLKDSKPEEFMQLQRSRTGFIESEAGKKQFVAQLASSDAPIVVRVVTDADRILAKFTHNTQVRIASALLIALIMLGMLSLLLRQIRRVENSEARLQLTQFAVDESPDMIFWSDQEGRIRYANRRLTEVTRHDQDALLQLSFIDLLGNGNLRWEKLYTDLQTQRRKSLESVLCNQDGTSTPVELTLALIAHENQSYLCVSARDITERHAAQQELRRHRDHLQDLVNERTAEIRTMLDANPLAVVLCVQDRMQQVNPAFESLFGYSMNSISGLPESLIHASSASYATVRSNIQSRISMGGTYRGEAELRRSDGSLFWAMLFARALQADSAGRGVIFIIEDVTAQRGAAQALRQSEQLKRSVLDATADGFALIDHERRLVDMNQALCQQLEQTRTALLGQSPETVWGKDIAEQIFPANSGNARQARQIEVEVAVGDNAQPRPFLVSTGAVCGEHGKIEHRFAFLTDISQRKEIERSLVEAKEAAETASHAKSIFLTNMSHELRTPMHAILSFSEVGMQKSQAPQNADLTRYFERIQLSGQRLLALLNDLLDMSRLETDRMSYAKSRHFLQNTLHSAVKEMSSLLASKQLRIELDEPPARLVGVYDRVRITQVIINLLSNAIRFSPQGACIHISCQNIPANNENPAIIEFSIRDEGPGIPAEDIEYIFDNLDKRMLDHSSGGTGLGLTISLRIIKDHEGDMQAANHPQGGAVFTVRLPAGV